MQRLWENIVKVNTNRRIKLKFPGVYKFSNEDINKLILLVRKCCYPYEYIDRWERFNEESLPIKKTFYSKLYSKGITDEDYAHTKKVWGEIKNLVEYHDLYIQSDTLLLVDVFENFRGKCIEIYGLDRAYFLSEPELACQACLKKTRVKLQLLTDYDMLLMFEKGIRGRICQEIYRYAKANNKYMNNYDRRIILSYLMYLDTNNLHGWAMLRKTSYKRFTMGKKVIKI